jgi:uncharacterized membrane protein YgcG
VDACEEVSGGLFVAGCDGAKAPKDTKECGPCSPGGSVWESLANAAQAISVFLFTKDVATGIAQGPFKTGSHSWQATKQWYGVSRALEPGTIVHHWAIEKGSAFGKAFPEVVNQPWNLMPTDFFTHTALHSSYATTWDKFVHGTPQCFIALAFSAARRVVKGVVEEALAKESDTGCSCNDGGGFGGSFGGGGASGSW